MTGLSKRVWILGAPDPEMAAIEQLLRECGEHVEYTTESSGERVSPRTAYSGEHVVPDVTGHVYTVECAPRLFGLIDPATGRELDAPVIWDGDVTRIDHHRPGDPGFGHGPDDFLAASSIGQVIAELARLVPERFDKLPAWEDFEIDPCSDELPVGVSYQASCGGDRMWVVTLSDGQSEAVDEYDYDWESGLVGAPTIYVVPHDLVIAAACDHCLGHAWAGRCPGVTRDDVREYRARTAATRPVEPVEADEYHRRFTAAITEITHAPTAQIDDCACGQGLAWHDRGSGECYDCGTPFVRVADLRGRHVPELPDAACYLGDPYVASVTDRDGRTKIVLGGATTERIVNAFMRVWAPAQKLTGIYGDPVRGFAGGYEVAS